MEESLSHTRWNVQYHIVFIPKKRRAILGGYRSEYLYMLLKRAAQEMESTVDTLKTDDDNHVHLLIRVPPKVSVSELMQRLKGKSAYGMLQRFPELRKELPEGTFWARGYYVASVGGLNVEDVREYIMLGQLLGKDRA